jgi:hypothetical protein
MRTNEVFNPKLYVSTSDGKWRVIYQEQQMCKDSNNVDDVMPIYESIRKQANLPDLHDIPLWDGNYGKFRQWK